MTSAAPAHRAFTDSVPVQIRQPVARFSPSIRQGGTLSNPYPVGDTTATTRTVHLSPAATHASPSTAFGNRPFWASSPTSTVRSATPATRMMVQSQMPQNIRSRADMNGTYAQYGQGGNHPGQYYQYDKRSQTPSPVHPAHLTYSYKRKSQSRRRLPRSSQNSSNWQRSFCLDDIGKCFKDLDGNWVGSQRRATMGGVSRPRGGGNYEFRDKVTNRAVSVDSTESDFDMPPDPLSVIPARIGPRDRGADDFNITVRDLFPCLTSLFDGWCTPDGRNPRRLIRPRGNSKPSGPQLETVCLECGNVLHHHQLPDGLMRDALGERYNWPCAAGGPPHRAPTKSIKFEGYPQWDVADEDNFGNRICDEENKAPLPSFAAGPPRQFRNHPGRAVRSNVVDSDFYTFDESGKIVLPEFPDDQEGTR